MKELSIFIDESGDFGKYQPHSPYYIVTLVFHDQSLDISENIRKFRETMLRYDMLEYIVHAGPLIRRENEFSYLHFSERKRIFDGLFHFVRTTDITYQPIIVEKENLTDETELVEKITKQLSRFLSDNLETFTEYDRIIVYYDFGQLELASILVDNFYKLFSNVDFRKVIPADYKLFQAADMFCTVELLSLKATAKTLSKSEVAFFASERDFRKSYLKAIHRKRFSGQPPKIK